MTIPKKLVTKFEEDQSAAGTSFALQQFMLHHLVSGLNHTLKAVKAAKKPTVAKPAK